MIARQVLVAEGHGLQRYGLALTHADAAERNEALEHILPHFAPELSTLLSALVDTCTGEGDRRETGLALARALNNVTKSDSPLQRGDQMALFVCFMSGLFGPRPERDAVYPARALFATARALRRISRRDELIDQIDADIPSFPLSEPDASRCRSELSVFPDDETNIERAIRAYGGCRVQPRFSSPEPRPPSAFRGFVSTSASVAGRCSHLHVALTTESLPLVLPWCRGCGPAGALRTSCRQSCTRRDNAGRNSRAGPRAGQWLPARQHPSQRLSLTGLNTVPVCIPRLAHLTELHALSDEELVAAAGESAAAKLTRIRLFSAVSVWEMLVARNGRRGDFAAEWQPVLPTHEEGDPLVSADFMYWRAACRSVHWPAADAYGNFIESWLPRLTELTPKLEAELLVLLRQWLRQSADHREQAAGFVPILRERFDALLDDEHASPGSDERVFALIASIASLSQAAWGACVRRLTADPRYDLSDFGRVLDSPRQSGWADELVKDDVFRECHTYLIAGDSVRHMIARPEWTRHALERARGAASVRWLVSRGGHYDFIASPQFASWFRQRGLRAIEDPQTALIELLEIATQTVSDPYIDIVQQHLLDRTLLAD